MTDATPTPIQPEPLPAAPESLLGRALNWTIVAAIFYLLLTLGMTYPLVMRMRDHVPYGAVDLWQNYWNFWWWKQCLLELGQNPNFTSYLFHPTGADLVFYTHSPFNMIVALPVTAIWGPAAATNFCVLFSLWLSGVTMYLLIKDLTGDSRGAFLGGIVFAFFPQLMEQTLEHLNLFAIEFIPLALLFFFRIARSGGWANVVGLAMSFALNMFVGWHLGILLSLLLVPMTVMAALRRERPPLLFARDLVLSGLLALVLILPNILPLARGMLGGEGYFQKPAEDKGIDLMFLLLPSEHHPIWGSLTFDAYAFQRAYRASGFLCFLGFTPLVLTIVAILRGGKRTAGWAALFVLSLVFALGAHPYWAGKLYDGVTLPFAYLTKLPVLSLMRVANRFLILTQVALAVLAAIGWSSLKKRSDLLFLALCALVLIEYLWIPYPLQPVEMSPYYDQMAASERRGAVLDIPFTSNGRTVLNMAVQTRHERHIAGGYLSTLPPAAAAGITGDPVLSQLAGVEPQIKGSIDRAHLLRIGFDTVILHKDRSEKIWRERYSALDPRDLFEHKAMEHYTPIPQATFATIRQALEDACGPKAYEDEDIIVFHLDGAGRP